MGHCHYFMFVVYDIYGRRVIDSFLFLQGLGTFIYVMWTIGSWVIPTFLTTKYPLTGEAVLQHIQRLPSCIAFLPPAILESIVLGGDISIAKLASVKRVMFGGAPLRRTYGDTLVKKGVPLVTAYGM